MCCQIKLRIFFFSTFKFIEMKPLLSIAVVILVTVNMMFAQFLSPNLEANTYNGDTVHLYDDLDQGKVVLFYMFDQFNESCWNYHFVLQDFYELYGPSGTNTIDVYAIRGVDNLYTPWGFWDNGIDYNIIYGSLNGYWDQTFGFFTDTPNKIWRVCPDRSMMQFDALDFDSLQIIVQGCNLATQPRDVRLVKTDMDTTANCPNEARSVNAYISNIGTMPLNSLDIAVTSDNETVQNYHWTGDLQTYQLDTIVLNDVVTNGSPVVVSITASNPNNQADADTTNNTLSDQLESAVWWDEDSIFVEIQTDGFGHQLYWDIRDDHDSVIVKGGNKYVGIYNASFTPPTDPETQYLDDTYYTAKASLADYENACITIRVLSGYGYGTCCDYGNGYVRFKKGDETIFEYTDFGRRAYGKITTTVVDTEKPPTLSRLKAYPNPTESDITLSFHLGTSAALALQVYNSVGQQVYQAQQSYTSGAQQHTLQTSSWPVGLYFATLRDAVGGVQSVRFVVAR
jgi:hypothetical protein